MAAHGEVMLALLLFTGGGCWLDLLGDRSRRSGIGQTQKQRRWVAMDLGDGMECSGGGWGGSLGNRVRSKID